VDLQDNISQTPLSSLQKYGGAQLWRRQAILPRGGRARCSVLGAVVVLGLCVSGVPPHPRIHDVDATKNHIVTSDERVRVPAMRQR
jgi:hypothetical protein